MGWMAVSEPLQAQTALPRPVLLTEEEAALHICDDGIVSIDSFSVFIETGRSSQCEHSGTL